MPIPKVRRWRFRYYTYDGTATTLAPYRTLIVTAPTKFLARLQAPRAPLRLMGHRGVSRPRQVNRANRSLVENQNMTIKRVTTAQLTEIVAGLVKQGLTFEVTPHRFYDDEWTITLTGGY